MKSTMRIICTLIAMALLNLSSYAEGDTTDSQRNRWTDSFDLKNCNFSDTGRNTCFILVPDYQLILKGFEDPDSVTLVITVLKDTVTVDGVVTRIVEERESANGDLVEVSRNFFAFCRTYAGVFYFGEDVDIYEGGKVANHSGSWRAGENGFKPGLMMPGLALFGSSYYQEIATGVAMDRARIVATDSTMQTPTGPIDHCLVTEETSPLEPGVREFKVYAPGIGLLKDGELLLVRYGVAADGKQE